METNISNKYKAYTSLEQSKQLAKFLPLESADMKWYFWKSEIDAPKLPTFGYSKDAAESYKDTEAVYLPCWSLAALLDIIPDGQVNRITSKGKWMALSWPHYISKDYDSAVDACYALILKLHEQNIL